jgi:type IV pilus assembly protein PilE
MITKNSGFTLIELMVVIAIVGILAAVAYPAYTSSVNKGNRADGIDSLVSLAGYMEEYYLNNDTYVGSTVANSSSSDGLYTLSITSADAFSYTLTATPVKGDSECGNLTLNSLGQKGVTATGATAADCW